MPPRKSISPQDAWRAVERGEGRLVDVREPGEFETVRTPRAENFPLSSLEERAAGIPAGGPLFLLCAAGSRAVAAAEILAENGRDGVVVEGGMIAWQRKGLPIHIGVRNVWSMDRQVRFAAGLLVLAGLSLGWWVNAGFLLIAAFVGAGLTFSGITGACGMAYVLARLPWNRA